MKRRIEIRNSVTKKLFIITAIMFAVFIAGTLIIQSAFFERFYIRKKVRDLESSARRFSADYSKQQYDVNLGELMEEYEENNNIKIVIFKNNRLKFSSAPSKFRPDMSKIRELTEFINSWGNDPYNLQLLKRKNGVSTVRTNGTENNAGSIISMVYLSETGEVIFAVSSLQYVSEAVSVIEDFYLYFCIGAVFFIILLAFIYSNMITKPLIKINSAATRMANLDFTEKCDVKSEDEIGNVASSLNFLSENLDEALTSLKDANAKLEEDIEKERMLERMRKEFVAAVSHELKTPISLIDGYAVGLKDDIFEGEEKDYYLDIIIDEARKMGHLVSDMLDLSYLESGAFKLKKETFDLGRLVRATLSKYENHIYDKSASVKLSLLENIIINADPNRLEQVLTNFITNAVRHVNEDGTIFVSMADRGNEISVEIENTGSSISEEELSKIWDKFYKVDKSRNRGFGGTGIGLSIVKNILTLHGYTFGVANTERGVKFYFNVSKEYTAEE